MRRALVLVAMTALLAGCDWTVWEDGSYRVDLDPSTPGEFVGCFGNGALCGEGEPLTIEYRQ